MENMSNFSTHPVFFFLEIFPKSCVSDTYLVKERRPDDALFDIWGLKKIVRLIWRLDSVKKVVDTAMI